jgi:hypothetical protein
MKILCGISGLEFQCEHFPASLTSREVTHPIFSLPQKKLLSYTGKWAGGELTPTDSYLLFLAILNSSELVEFRVPVTRTALTDSIVAQNMEPLVKTVIKLNTVTSPSVVFPRYAVTPETKTLGNVKYWIENWKDSYQDFLDGYKRDSVSRALITREAALERMIKNPHLPVSAYASKIADWASIAGSFPTFNTISPFNKLQVSINDYWKDIIIRCTREENIYAVPEKDIKELLEHCEGNIAIGTIYSNALFTVLRKALQKQHDFLGLGDIDISAGNKYQFLESSDTVESANLKALIDSAPTEEPKPEQYPSRLAFIRAKMRYQLARDTKS